MRQEDKITPRAKGTRGHDLLYENSTAIIIAATRGFY